MTSDTTPPNAMVYILDDDPSVRKAMTRLFKSVDLPVSTFETAADSLNHQRDDVPGCLILDVDMPDQTGLELQEELTAQHFDLPIVFMTGHGDIPMTVKAMQAGAVDFLPKPVDHSILLDTVRKAIDRHARDRHGLADLRDFQQRVETLTKREYEVMTWVVAGLLNKQIAKKMGITEYTVKVHRRRVMEKTGVDSVAELARRSERCGIAAADNK